MFPESLMKLKQLPSRERERKKEEIYLQRCLLRERRKPPEAGGQRSHTSWATECPDPVLGHTGPPVLTLEERRQAHGLLSPRLLGAGDACAFPSNHLERRANLPAVGDWLLQRVREPAAAQSLGGRAGLLIGPTEASGKMQDCMEFKRSG